MCRPTSATSISGGTRDVFNGPWQSDQARVDAEEAAEQALSTLKGAVIRVRICAPLLGKRDITSIVKAASLAC